MGQMPTVQVKLEGGKELMAALRRLGIETSQVLELAANVGAQVIVDDANPRAPQPLITTETVKSTNTAVEVDIGPPDEKWDWKFLETGAQPHTITGSPLVFMGREGLVRVFGVGHPGMAARPFLRPAFDGKHPEATKGFGNIMLKAIHSVKA